VTAIHPEINFLVSIIHLGADRILPLQLRRFFPIGGEASADEPIQLDL